jgi:hypothetical protein
MQSKHIGDYGGPYKDALPVEDPETQLSSDAFNALAEDAAQLTRTGLRAIIRFATQTASDPAVMQAVGVWGNATAQQPTITRRGIGHYAVEYPVSFVDPNGVSEDVSFLFGQASIEGDAPGHVRVSGIAANVVVIYVFDKSWEKSDLGGDIPIVVWLR